MTSARSKAETAATEAGNGAAGARLARLLDASPAVVYSFEAKGDFSPTYVSDNITRLFGYAARDYLEDPDFWRGHVHPDDLARVEAEMSDLFTEGRHACEFGATIDKYIGDAIMVFFGDPESKGVKEDALACVRMAVAMLRRMRVIQAEWQERGAEQPFHLRVGIHTGFVTVGNFGSEDRMDYTIIGRPVNLTARLQSYAELDGILLGHETYSLVKGEVAAEEQAPIKVKGFAEPIRCYKVLGLYDDLAREGAVIREESDGFKVLLDLQKRERADIVAALEGIIARLKK
jgi:class 3 adenylate cyclase